MPISIVIFPTLNLYRSKAAGDFVIMNFARNSKMGGMPTGTGPLVRVPGKLLRKSGVELLIEHLAAFDSRSVDRGEFAELSSETQDRFFLEHDLITVRQRNRKAIELAPMSHAKPGGFAGKPADAVMVSTAALAEDFWRTLSSVYDKCT